MKRGNCRGHARHASHGNIRIALCLLCFLGVSLSVGKVIHAQATASDPGVRGGAPGAGGSIAGLTPQQLSFFEQNLGTFSEINNVTSLLTGNTGLIGLGPTFDSNSCATCHAQPAIGGPAK